MIPHRRRVDASQMFAAVLGICAVMFFAPSRVSAAEDVLAFQLCTFEANRYVVCRVPPASVESALKSAEAIHVGEVFGKYLIESFKARGCTGPFDSSAFVLNGVFFSLDSRALEKITCPEQSGKLKFSPEKAMAFEFMQFWFDQTD